MNITAVQPAPSLTPRKSLARSQETFAQIISRAQERPGVRTQTERARASAEQLVSIALIEPALRAVRESGGAAPPFAPTPAERRFGAMLDAHRAVEIARSTHMPLVERIAADMLRSSTPSPAPGASGPGGFAAFAEDLAP